MIKTHFEKFNHFFFYGGKTKAPDLFLFFLTDFDFKNE